MARHGITLDSPARIEQARAWLARAEKIGWRVEFKEAKRSDPQNDRMWEMLGRVSKHMQIGGKSFSPDDWKCIFMKAMGQEARFLPTLDGSSYFPTGFRSSDLGVQEMSELQTFIEAWCAEAGFDLWRDAA